MPGCWCRGAGAGVVLPVRDERGGAQRGQVRVGARCGLSLGIWGEWRCGGVRCCRLRIEACLCVCVALKSSGYRIDRVVHACMLMRR